MNEWKAIEPPYAKQRIAGWDRLAAALNQVPEEHMEVVDERASIFVSGMEAMARASKAENSSGASKRGKR